MRMASLPRLPDGYQTVIGERGTQLSGGQRQRLAIARALLRDSPILVLDEALSSVDTENEAIIQQALDRLMTGRTTLILAHRLSSVIGADRILVLNDGAVVQSGHHRDLIQQDGPYRDLMGPQLGERDGVVAPSVAAETARPDAPATGAVSAACRRMRLRSPGRTTIRTLLRVVRPYRGQLAITVLTGIGRVVAFIGVSVLGALVLGAVRNGSPTGMLIAALLVTAPLAGLLHWLESWIAHAMAYALLADMRIDLFRKLDALAPAYLLRRRSGRSGGAGDPGRRNGRVFLRPHHRAGDRRGAGAGQRDRGDGLDRLAVGLGAGAVPAVRRRLPGARAPAHRPAGIGRPWRAGDPSAPSRPKPSRA